jgi:type IV fimbrial biogenesis protein FimT
MCRLPSIRPVRAAARGFTLLEVMVVLVIGGIVLSMGLPSFVGIMDKYLVDGQNSGLMDDLLLAREEAKNSTLPVSICASSSGTACTASNWHAGHIVFRDNGTKGSVDAGDTVLRYTKAAPSGITIAATVLSTGAAYGPAFLQFDADGRPDTTTALRFTTCKAGSIRLLINVQRNGYIATDKGSAC